MSVPKRSGIEIAVDYNLRISREARSCRCLVIVCFWRSTYQYRTGIPQS